MALGRRNVAGTPVVDAIMNDLPKATRKVRGRGGTRAEITKTHPNRFSSIVLFTAIAVAPFPFGSTDPTVIAVWCIALGVALAMASTRGLRKLQIIALAASAALVIAYMIILHEQIAIHPWTGIGANPIWIDAAALLGADIEPSISIVRVEPLFALGAPLAALLAFLTSCVVCSDPIRSRQLLRIIAWSGGSYAVLGIVLFILDPTKVLWRHKLAYVESLTGPFVNRNTAAVYFGSCACVSMLLLLQELRSFSAGGKRRLTTIFVTTERAVQWRAARAASLVVILVVAMLMTASRAGVVISLFGLVIAFTTFWWRDLSRRRVLLVSAIAGCVFVIVVVQVFGGSVGARFNEFGVTDAVRLDYYRSTLQMIADRPWLGSGFGSFIWAFPSYRDGASVWGIVNRAHNTLLEIAAEAGIPFAAVIAIAWGCTIGALVHGIRVRRRGLITPVAAISVAMIAILHSQLDFSLQIPGYAIMVFSLIGAGIAQSSSWQWQEHQQKLG